jgi:DNA-binding NtrC family response regulator
MIGVMLVSEDRELEKKVMGCLAEISAKLVAVSGSMRAATDFYQKLVPDMVILDTFVPESSGLEVLKTLKRINENCVFVMLSRLRTRAAIERAFRLGAHDVLIFPLDTEVLCQTVLHRLESQVTQRAVDERSESLK